MYNDALYASVVHLFKLQEILAFTGIETNKSLCKIKKESRLPSQASKLFKIVNLFSALSQQF